MAVKLLFLGALATALAAPSTNAVPRASCTFTDAANAIKQKTSCSTIVLNNVAVPAGTTLDLTGLKDETHVIFTGKTTFGYKEWLGPLISVSGKGIVVEGASGHSIDCQGQRWWDGKGSNDGKKKPKFFSAHKLANSRIQGLNVVNTPVQAFSINGVTDLGVYNVRLDNSLGDTKGGHNTDAFDVGSSNGVYISGAWVRNQDDCLAVNSGTNITFTGGDCSGGHGLSIGSVGGRDDNTVKEVRILNSKVSNSDNGVRVKTVYNAIGSVSDVVYDNIVLTNIAKYGIVIEQDYQNGGPNGNPTAGVPITGLTVSRVVGSVKSTGTNVYILCAACREWTWTNNRVTGGTKVRCEGGQPTCKTCEVYHDECRYDKAPPVSQVVAMAKRLQDAERAIEQLRGNGSIGSSEEPSAPVDADHVVDDAQQHPVSLASESLPARHAQVRSIPLAAVDQLAPSSSGETPAQGRFVSEIVPASWQPASQDVAASLPHSAGATILAAAPEPEEPAATELRVDEHGKINYYGPTSAVHDGPQNESVQAPALTAHESADGTSTRDDQSESLSSYVREATIWEDFALGNASLQTGIPRHMLAKLLRLHWTWVSPMFMWVYRPAFIRDMATGGRYYSEFLLTVMCGHAAKYQDSNSSDFLLARARRLLGAAIQQPSSIPTVQALLQLSARDLAHGSISQAWVYGGIAFRMASDLGLQHSGTVVKGLSPVDLEIRRRLFWGCYFWDKATSLYAGRLPAVTEVLDQSSLDLLDRSTENEIWTPYYGDSLDSPDSPRSQYPPRKSHAVSCFVNSCRLSIIINEIVVQLYARRRRSVTEAALTDIKRRLDLWRNRSPAHLRYDPDNLPTICPPPHLISQNLLYFASVILAHRPFWAVPDHYQTCITASQSIEKLVLLLESTFGLGNITYLMGYCIYTGASAILEDAKKGSDSSQATLQTFLRALNTGMKRCPLLERSMKIIVKGMSATPTHKTPVADQMSQDPIPTATANTYIPAFPYVDPTLSIDFDMSRYLGGADLDTMSGLNSFPEAQMDLDDFFDPALQ
ncbi:fungal specific transcription factor domain-containing protein [Purpureocillium lavendulum]|uniref:endo-polygalacturonase n=1 Tax=Purpureocillium lavendulum TaxID=1247861 RepID=A0AB34FL91_9HYPO|nr:fungal specific transcription factor domain-containing protein [Purpureocillium lavendulum]